jgi:hypothetical protein
MNSILRRYTELPFVIDFLQTKKLNLLNPANWEDRNDSHFIKQYAATRSLCATYALCLADSQETYHHWRAFSHGSGGACIQFDREKFLAHVRAIPGLMAAPVRYKTIKQLRDAPPTCSELPFLKRWAFSHESEFRLFVESATESPDVYPISVPLSTVDRIILSPWLPIAVADSVKATLKSIEGCSDVRMYRSTLVENEDWKGLANGA